MEQIQRLLIVASTEIQLEASELERATGHQFEIRRVDSVDAARQHFASPYATAWLVDDSLGEGAETELFADLKDVNDCVPFIYVDPSSKPLSGFGPDLPDQVVRSTHDHADLMERIDEILRARVFEPQLAQAITEAAKATIRDSFVPDAELRGSWLRAGQQPVHEVNSTIPFCGPHVSGRLSVSGSRSTLTRIYEATVPGAVAPRDRTLEDLVGEISNQVLGGIKRNLGAGGLDLSIGVPLVYSGPACPVRYRTRSGSLLLHVGGERAPDCLSLDVSFDSLRRSYDPSASLDDDDGAATGVLAFL
ncbi:MAG: chemotaxis protein CheX [Myxococcales bacterium FL481]|nr:MAG: chemotaxis protein CheX [Myxococcales bacterium FL481]